MLHSHTKRFITFTLSMAFCLLLGDQQGKAQNAKKFAKETDQLLKKITATFKELPSISVVVVKGDKPVFMNSYGYADIANKVKAKNNTPYYIASVTKSFMGMAAAILDHQGKVSLDASLAESMPYIKFNSSIKAHQVKLRHLLNHTSGIKNDYFGFRAACSGLIDRKEMDWVLENKSDSTGKAGKFQYTNLGYNIYSHMTDKKLGMPWQDVLNELLFKPLKMKRTTAYMSLAKKQKWPCAQPYHALGKNGSEKLYLMKKDNTMQSAGGLITTVEDLANWLAFNMNEGRFKGKQIVPATVVRMAQANMAKLDGTGDPYKYMGYGLGWVNALYKGKRVLQHDGSFAGFKAHITFMPEEKTGIAVLLNDRSFGGTVAYELSQFVYDWWLSSGKSVKSAEASIEEIQKKITKLKKRRATDKAKRVKRKWKLTEPLKSYTGIYYSKALGKLKVSIKNGVLEIVHGNMHAVSEPYEKENAIRVEMLPKRGWTIAFKIAKGKKAHELDFDEGWIMKRIAD